MFDYGLCGEEVTARILREALGPLCLACQGSNVVEAVQDSLVETVRRGEFSKIPEIAAGVWHFLTRHASECGIPPQSASTNASLLFFAMVRVLYGILDALAKLGVDPQLMVSALELSIRTWEANGAGYPRLP